MLIIVLGANNASILECRTVTQASETTANNERDGTALPDCCLNGMCPRHQAHPSPDSSTADCMHMASHSTVIVGAAQMPAVFPIMQMSGVEFSVQERTRNVSAPQLPNADFPVLTPPPKL